MITGTFDPPTLGHEAVIKRALAVFDKVAVAVLVNPDKTCLFSVAARVEMLKNVFGDRIEVIAHAGWAVDAAKEVKADVLVRGIRGESDLAYEEEMARYNRAHGKDTLFFFAEKEFEGISSTLARAALTSGGDSQKYMSDGVLKVTAAVMEGKNG